MTYNVILDCYTDEPSGLGVPPYLGVHQRYAAGAFALLGEPYHYLTIDDLRYSHGERESMGGPSNVRVRNITHNAEDARAIIDGSDHVFVIMGCFVPYRYVSAEPPAPTELCSLLASVRARKTLIYALGGVTFADAALNEVFPDGLFDTIVHGLGYNYILYGETRSQAPNYAVLREVALASGAVLRQIKRPQVIELETGTGCGHKPGCSFCIESVRKLPLVYRPVQDIIDEVRACVKHGAMHFRLGRQPNFFEYQHSDPGNVEALLAGIRSSGSSIKTLHIDNVGAQSVVSQVGHDIARAICTHCTSGNIAPFGVESFDPEVRHINRLNGTNDDVMQAIQLLNELGASRGDSGLPRFLPGINIIHGLPGQSTRTLEHNRAYLSEILHRGWLTRRTFVRPLTPAFGISLGKRGAWSPSPELAYWQETIAREFEEPMLRRIVPIGTVLREVWAEVWENTGTVCRQLASCPVRVLCAATRLPLDQAYDFRVTGYHDRRTVLGEVVE